MKAAMATKKKKNRIRRAAVAAKKKVVRRKTKAPSRKSFDPVELKYYAPAEQKAQTHLKPSFDGRPALEIPWRYNEDKLTLLVRDPWWLYAYWEVTPDRESGVARAVRREPMHKVLRLYEGGPETGRFFDIEVGNFLGNWYVEVGKPDSEWVAEIGWRADRHFYPCVRSNRVRTPRYGVSDILDEEWMLPDATFWKLFGRSAAAAGVGNSESARAAIDRLWKERLSSESLSRV